MIPIEPQAQQALERYLTTYRTRMVDIALALSHETITKEDIDQAQRLMFDQAVEPPPKPRHIRRYLISQFGSLVAGGAVGAILAEPRIDEYFVVHIILILGGFCFMVAGYEN